MTNIDKAPGAPEPAPTATPSVPTTSPKSVTIEEVKVVSVWKHPMVLITALAASIPTILLILVQLKELPFLPTNVLAGITSAIAILTAVATILRNLGLLGQIAVTPTAINKMNNQ